MLDDLFVVTGFDQISDTGQPPCSLLIRPICRRSASLMNSEWAGGFFRPNPGHVPVRSAQVLYRLRAGLIARPAGWRRSCVISGGPALVAEVGQDGEDSAVLFVAGR